MVRRRLISGVAGFTLIELLVVIAIFALLLGLLLPAVQMARDAARRTTCLNNVRQQMLALSQYENVNRYFPYGARRNGAMWASFILPYLEESNLHDLLTLRDQTEIDHPDDLLGTAQWLHPGEVRLTSDDPIVRNVAALRVEFPVFRCPSSQRNALTPGTSVGLNGNDRVFRPSYTGCGSHVLVSDRDPKLRSAPRMVMTGALGYGYQVRVVEIRDGLSNTLFVAECESLVEPKAHPEASLAWIEADNDCVRYGMNCVGMTNDKALLGSHDVDAGKDLSEAFSSTAFPPNFFTSEPDSCFAGPRCQPATPEFQAYELSFRSPHSQGIVLGFGDASSRFVSLDIDAELFRSIGSISGAEVASNLD